jgi:hypothetical protein
MNDLLFHLPIIWIVSTFSPARYMAMAAPDLIECVPMSSALNPSRRSPIDLVTVRSCSSTAVEGRCFNSLSAVSAHALIPGLAIRGCRPDVCLTRSVVSVLRDSRPIVSVLLSAECDGDGVGEPRRFLVVGGYRVPIFSKPHVVNRDHCGDSSSPGVGILAGPHREEEGRHYQLSDGFVSCCRPHCSYSPDHFQGEGLLRSWVEVFVRVPFQLQCQDWFKTPCGVVDGALKFVKPEGLSHTVEGGTNSAGLAKTSTFWVRPSRPRKGSRSCPI